MGNASKGTAFSDYRQVLQTQKQYRFMIAANAISRFGDSIDVIAFSWLIYEVTGSAAWLAILVGVNMLPSVLLQPFTGALASYLDKKKMVVLCDFVRGCVVCATGVCMLLGVLNSALLLCLTLLGSCVEALRLPCGMALLPHVLEKEHYKVALSFNQGVCRAMELVGLAAAGAVIAAIGTGGALLVDAATFFISAVLLFCMRVRKEVHAPRTSTHTLQLSDYTAHLREGARYFKKSQLVILLCFLCAVLNVALIPVENLNVAFVKEYLQLGLLAVSVGSVALTLGTVLGALCYPLVSKGVQIHTFICVGGALIGALYGAFVATGLLQSADAKTLGYAVACFAFGCVNSMIGMAVQVHFITSLPEEMLGRIGGFFNAIVCGSVPAASFAISVVVRFVPMQGLFLGVGALALGVFVAVWVAGRKVLRAP